jgi:hypothetical protein
MNEADSPSEAPRDVGGVFEALCAGQGKEEVVEDMVSRGWPREEATSVVQRLEDHVSKFLAAGRESDAPQPRPPEEPMKSFRPYVGDPIRETGEIGMQIVRALIALGLTALLAYSCAKM